MRFSIVSTAVVSAAVVSTDKVSAAGFLSVQPNVEKLMAAIAANNKTKKNPFLIIFLIFALDKGPVFSLQKYNIISIKYQNFRITFYICRTHKTQMLQIHISHTPYRHAM